MNNALQSIADRDLASVPTTELRAQLAQAIGITARTLQSLGAIWRELESRGEDLSDLRTGLMAYLPLIAAGRLEPEAVVRCAGQATLLKAISDIPIEDQRRLLDAGVPLASLDAEGSPIQVLRPLEKLSVADVRLAFSGGHVRSAADQARMLATQKPEPTRARAVIVKVRLTQDEYKRLRKLAAQKEQTVPTWSRDVLLNARAVDS